MPKYVPRLEGIMHDPKNIIQTMISMNYFGSNRKHLAYFFNLHVKQNQLNFMFIVVFFYIVKYTVSY